jgi:putative ABC transport system substrate-binding protein
MRRRDFITLLGGAAAAWPLAAWAQQPSMPVIGFLASNSAESLVADFAAVRRGLSAEGYIEGRNVAIEYRYADFQYDRLPALAADLVRRQVAVIFATGSVRPAVTAKAATTRIPIVFLNGSDPVKLGLVASLSRPGGNATGVSLFGTELSSKRLQLLHDLLPKAAMIAFLVNLGNPNTESDIANVQAAAEVMGVQILLVNVGTERDLDDAFAKVVQQQADALLIGTDPLFNGPQREQLVILAARHHLPVMYPGVSPSRGQLISYGFTDDLLRQAGVYIGRILNGAEPANLPVVQPNRFELVINLRTAKALGLTVPPSLLAIADEVIE